MSSDDDLSHTSAYTEDNFQVSGKQFRVLMRKSSIFLSGGFQINNVLFIKGFIDANLIKIGCKIRKV